MKPRCWEDSEFCFPYAVLDVEPTCDDRDDEDAMQTETHL